jgi:hypothetical protein
MGQPQNMILLPPSPERPGVCIAMPGPCYSVIITRAFFQSPRPCLYPLVLLKFRPAEGSNESQCVKLAPSLKGSFSLIQ